ncbi:hypothetical protein [Microbulbifer sp. S227A]|uniref:hypothetical protein n=1 Tax=Microbulbifer sp. S227A TaxID=3415131 RepID=UPI003C7C863A
MALVVTRTKDAVGFARFRGLFDGVDGDGPGLDKESARDLLDRPARGGTRRVSWSVMRRPSEATRAGAGWGQGGAETRLAEQSRHRRRLFSTGWCAG